MSPGSTPTMLNSEHKLVRFSPHRPLRGHRQQLPTPIECFGLARCGP